MKDESFVDIDGDKIVIDLDGDDVDDYYEPGSSEAAILEPPSK